MPEGQGTEPDDDSNKDDIIVTWTQHFMVPGYWYSNGGSSDGWLNDLPPDGYYSGGGTTAGSELPDEAVIKIERTFDGPLSPLQSKALESLKIQIGRATEIVNSLPDTARVRLADGSVVTGAEMKALWAKVDFVINREGHTYANNTARGEANFRDGDPVISFNIDQVVTYYTTDKGLSFLIAHELGHMTAAGRDFNRMVWADGVLTADENRLNEQIANDISRAFNEFGQEAYMDHPTHGYRAGSGTIFELDDRNPYIGEDGNPTREGGSASAMYEPQFAEVVL
jgi:hypothetical protein